MPVMDGYEASRKIISHTKNWQPELKPVIIALTASAFEEDREAVMAAGCHDFVGRPFQESDIFEKISRHLGVAYIYETVVKDSDLSVDPGNLFTEKLLIGIGRLPLKIIKQLKNAIELCDMEGMTRIIANISSENKDLARSLEELVEMFHYDRILALLDDASKIKNENPAGNNSN